MPIRPEAGKATRLGLVGIDRKCLVVTPSWMRHVIRTATERMTYPCIHDIKDQGTMHAQSRMQGGWWLPCLVSHSGHELTAGPRWTERNPSPVTRDDMTRIRQAADLDLETLDGIINRAGRSAQRGFFSEHMPGFDGHAQFHLHVLHLKCAVVRKAEFEEWRTPLQWKR